MELALLLARLVLAGVFLVAGIAKLADRQGSADALEGFGVPGPLAAPLGTLLPLVEIAVALALIPTASARWGALGALALLLLFIAGIGFTMARGNAPDCHCFGQLHSEPAGWRTLVRNGALAAIAAFILWQGWDDAGASTVGWIEPLSTFERATVAAGALMLALIAIGGWLMLQLMQQHGRLLLRLDALEAGNDVAPPRPRPEPNPGLPVGSPAPAFALPSLQGETVTLADLTARGRPVLLVFINPRCKKCTDLLPEIGRWQRDHAGTMTVALISRGEAEANRAKTAPHGIAPVLLQDELDVARAYLLTGTPTAVLIQPDGTIGSALGEKAEGIRRLVTTVTTTPTVQVSLATGAASRPTPAARLGSAG